MKDIHESLVNYFSKEADAQQTKEAKKFRDTNPEEFALLKKLWEHRRNISLQSRDTETAWNRFQSNISLQPNKFKVIPMFTIAKRIAIAATIIIASMAAWVIISNKSDLQTVEVAYDAIERRTVTLADGSVVSLNRGASISYPSLFSGDARTVQLKGEAFFDIKKNPSKPFIINTQNAEVKVLGTSFNVVSHSYNTKVSVKEGTVQLKSSLNKDQSIILTKGFTAITNGARIRKMETRDLNFDSWYTGIFTFKDTNIKSVFESLDSYYSGQLVLDNSTNANCTLTADFEKNTLGEIVEILRITCGLKVKEQDGKYLFY
jgi:transmembrane sensor